MKVPLTRHECHSNRILCIRALDRIIDAKIKQKNNTDPHQILQMNLNLRKKLRFQISEKVCEAVSNSYKTIPQLAELENCMGRFQKAEMFLEWAINENLITSKKEINNFIHLTQICKTEFKEAIIGIKLSLREKTKLQASLNAFINILVFAQMSDKYWFSQPTLAKQFFKLKKWLNLYKIWVTGEIDFIESWKQTEYKKSIDTPDYIPQTLTGRHESVPVELYKCLKNILDETKSFSSQKVSQNYKTNYESGANDYDRPLTRMVIQVHWEIIATLEHFILEPSDKSNILHYWAWPTDPPNQTTINSRIHSIDKLN